MALSGALQADFSDFVAEAQKASAALGVMDAEAKKTGTTLAKTGAAVDGFGKGANLTQLSTGLRSVDAMANAAGVSLAKPIAAIEELGQVSGKTYAQLGMLGTAGVAIGVALTGIELGKVIADLTGMNQVMTNLQDKYMPWIAAADAAANKQAVLQLALDRTGIAFDNVEEAAAASLKWIKEHQKQITTAADRQAYWEGQLRLFGAALPKMEAALANHTTTIKQLGIEYGINTDALTYYLAKKKDEDAALEKTTREAEAAAAAQEKLRASMFGTDTITKVQEMQAALGGLGNLTKMTQDEQTKLNIAVGEAIEAYKRMGQTAPAALNEIYNATVSIGKITTGLGSEWANVGTKFTPTADHIIAQTQQMTTDAAAYEAETRRMVDEAQKMAPPIAQAAAETKQLTVAFTQAASAIRMTASESIAAGKALEDAYRSAGIFVGQQIATGGYQQSQRLAAGREITGAGQTWGNTLNVNVNSTEAGDISRKLVDEMRRQGVRF